AAGTLRHRLVDTVTIGADPNVTSALCNSLGRLGAIESAPELINLLSDKSATVRAAAVRALGRLRLKQPLEKLVDLAENDSAASVRLAARAAVLLITRAGTAQTG
ncbi:MAG TPA: HEAT repeat domain-containing protein, partial [Blastocatellia bacterium]|nr:HEAT repeat domain-containing protein [Blastocatellia bacterium]